MKKLLLTTIFIMLLAGQSFAALSADSMNTISLTYPDVKLAVYHSGGASVASAVLMISELGGALAWTRQDSDIVELDAIEGIDTVSLKIGTLEWSTDYAARFEVTDADETDTTEIDTITTAAYPYPTNWDYLETNRKPTKYSIWGGGLYTQSDYSFTGQPFFIGDLTKIRFQAKYFGLDDNATFDSALMYIQTKQHDGSWVKVDSVTRDVDTVTTVPKFYAWSESLNVASHFSRIWGDSGRIYFVVTDSADTVGDTLDLDKRGFYYWIDFIR